MSEPASDWIGRIEDVASFQCALIKIHGIPEEVVLNQPMSGGMSVILSKGGIVTVPIVLPLRSVDEGSTLKRVAGGIIGEFDVTIKTFRRVVVLNRPNAVSHQLKYKEKGYGF